MLKILTEIDKSQGFRKFNEFDSYIFGSPCILSGASSYLELSLSDIVPNATGLDHLKMPFVFIPMVNLIKVPVAGVSPEISDMVPGILKEMQNSRILENMDLAIQAINGLLPDPVPVTGITIDTKGYPSYKLFGNLGYYRLDTRYTAREIDNPWPDLYQVSWFGQELYICTNIRGNNCCYLTVMSSDVKNQELLIRLMNYKYAFKRYGIKAISN